MDVRCRPLSPPLDLDNQHAVLNSFATCRRLLDYVKSITGIARAGKSACFFDDTASRRSIPELLDLMDHEGKLKELNAHSDEYASQYLSARHTYYALKIESRWNMI